MTARKFGRPAALLSLAVLTTLLTGCVGYYGGGGYADYGAGYYDTGVVEYGGWGGGYRVGPYRDRGGHFGRAGRGRAIPGIPAGRRGGGHGGGGRGR